jgi:hypothetical protein
MIPSQGRVCNWTGAGHLLDHSMSSWTEHSSIAQWGSSARVGTKATCELRTKAFMHGLKLHNFHVPLTSLSHTGPSSHRLDHWVSSGNHICLTIDERFASQSSSAGWGSSGLRKRANDQKARGPWERSGYGKVARRPRWAQPPWGRGNGCLGCLGKIRN